MDTETISSVPTLLLTFLGLMVLLAITVAASFIDVGTYRALISVAVAIAKALLVMIFFMHLRGSNRLLWVFAGAGFFWLSILMILTIGDFVTRMPAAFIGN
jgi:cytochrome c oxidase subunit IV